jgi:alanine dehydrogenase
VKIGIPREIKSHEYRVGLTPSSVREVVKGGSKVFFEKGAGEGIGCTDDAYRQAGAHILATAEEVYAAADLLIKVKEPQKTECAFLRPDHVLFTYLHLAADPTLAKLLCESGCTAIAYETITDSVGGLPVLAPMSEVAGRLSIQVGATALQKTSMGAGVLLGGIPGTRPARVLVLGGGVVGSNAARIASGMGAEVLVVDKSLPRLRYLDDVFGSAIRTEYPTTDGVDGALVEADLVIGAVLVPGATAPQLVKREQLKRMKPGSVMVDVAIDQGGCFETSTPTTHERPTFVIEEVVHYCVTNMPAAVPRTASFALNNATLPFVLALASLGWRRACDENSYLAAGLNVHRGKIVHPMVAAAVYCDSSEYRVAAPVQ